MTSAYRPFRCKKPPDKWKQQTVSSTLGPSPGIQITISQANRFYDPLSTCFSCPPSKMESRHVSFVYTLLVDLGCAGIARWGR
jgi:hypothetical protein